MANSLSFPPARLTPRSTRNQLRAEASLAPPPTSLIESPLITNQPIEHALLTSVLVSSIREHEAASLEPLLLRAADQCRGHLALNLAQVSSFSCAWINALLALTRRCESLGGQLAIFGLSLHAESFLRSTGLHKQLHLYRGRDNALAAVGLAPSPATAAALDALARALIPHLAPQLSNPSTQAGRAA